MYGTAYNTIQLGFGDVVSIFSFGFNAALFMHNTLHTYIWLWNIINTFIYVYDIIIN